MLVGAGLSEVASTDMQINDVSSGVIIRHDQSVPFPLVTASKDVENSDRCT